jgi:RNA polymerase sigma-70 factor (ECF subfamily)
MIPWFTALASTIVGRSDAPDIAQEAAQKFWAALPRFDATKGSARRFAQVILENQARSALRARRRRRVAVLGDRDVGNDRDDPAVMVGQRESHEKVRQAIRSLQGPQADAILLRYEGGLDYKSAAAQLGVSIATVASRVFRGITALRTMLEGEREP